MAGVKFGDHPRSRGEYVPDVQCTTIEPGSSPLSRGIRGDQDPWGGAYRIIPALAGNTGVIYSTHCQYPDHPRSRGEYKWPTRTRATYPDHPRSRGEYTLSSDRVSMNCGSSPLSRGIRHGPQLAWQLPRIIPALAGNTGRGLATIRGRTDHPRSRGEYKLTPVLFGKHLGSSPLSRGIPNLVNVIGSIYRIIPALAGNTTHRG